MTNHYIYDTSDKIIQISAKKSLKISQRSHSKVLVGRGRKTGGQWLTCAANSELCLKHDLTPNKVFTVQFW